MTLCDLDIDHNILGVAVTGSFVKTPTRRKLGSASLNHSVGFNNFFSTLLTIENAGISDLQTQTV